MENKKQKNTINTLYAFLVVSTILGFIPNGQAFIASLALWMVTLVSAYIYRAKDTEDGLIYNHMTYLIGTIWIATSLILVATMVAGFIVYYYGDHSALNSAMPQISNGVVPDEAFLRQIMESYFNTNKKLILTASITVVGPAILYFLYRVYNGLTRAAKGYRIANPKSWL